MSEAEEYGNAKETLLRPIRSGVRNTSSWRLPTMINVRAVACGIARLVRSGRGKNCSAGFVI